MKILLILLLTATPLYAQKSFVVKHRGSSPTLSPTQAVDVLKEIATDVGGGLLLKSSGNFCGGKYACDIICFANGDHYDVFIDGPDSGSNPDRAGRAEPDWTFKGKIDPARCEVVTKTEPEPEPEPEPEDDKVDQVIKLQLEIIQRLDNLEAGQKAQTEAIIHALKQLEVIFSKPIRIRF